MSDYPPSISHVDQTAPVPRRIRAVLNGRTVLDTTSAIYVWEWPSYPQYYIPAADIDPSVWSTNTTSRSSVAGRLVGTAYRSAT